MDDTSRRFKLFVDGGRFEHATQRQWRDQRSQTAVAGEPGSRNDEKKEGQSHTGQLPQAGRTLETDGG